MDEATAKSKANEIMSRLSRTTSAWVDAQNSTEEWIKLPLIFLFANTLVSSVKYSTDAVKNADLVIEVCFYALSCCMLQTSIHYTKSCKARTCRAKPVLGARACCDFWSAHSIYASTEQPLMKRQRCVMCVFGHVIAEVLCRPFPRTSRWSRISSLPSTRWATFVKTRPRINVCVCVCVCVAPSCQLMVFPTTTNFQGPSLRSGSECTLLCMCLFYMKYFMPSDLA